MGNYKKLFSIKEAIELLKKGHILTRLSWNNLSKIVIMMDNKEFNNIFLTEDSIDDIDINMYLLIENNDRITFNWSPNCDDQIANDWYIVNSSYDKKEIS